MYWASIALAVAGSVLYNLCQKSIAPAAHPLVSMAVTYVVALSLTLAALLVFPPQAGMATALRQANWASAALGAVIVLVEISFLLVYRSGWNVSMAALASQSTTVMVLIPVGLLCFRERVSPLNAVGMAVCLAGLALMNIK
ncbi:hypothetical protein EG831_03800 [bacterium]|nr:hypothetical protein [bacterium]